MVDLLKGENLSIEVHSSKTIPQILEGWMDVTHTPEDVRKVIRTARKRNSPAARRQALPPTARKTESDRS